MPFRLAPDHRGVHRPIALAATAVLTAATLMAPTAVAATPGQGPSPVAGASAARTVSPVKAAVTAPLNDPAPASSRSVNAPAVVLTGLRSVSLGEAGIGQWTPTGLAGVSVSRRTASSAASATVAVLSAAERRARGFTGPAFRLTRTDGRAGAPALDVKVDEVSLNAQFGANYASRVRWVQRPDAAIPTRPGQPASAAVSQPSTLMVAAAAPAAANGTGTFAATSLSPSASWQVSAQTGSFAWNYPLRTPPAAGGLQPGLALSYDSGKVDGATGVTNNQPSAVGEGWNLSGAGFIERSYQPCAIDGVAASGDLCWKSDNASISFGGRSGRLVKDSSNVWHVDGDDGSKIQKVTGAVNGDAGTAGTEGSAGEHWKLTTTDGTQYFFGLNRLPGWVSGNAQTQSAWTVPVFGNNSGEPCYNATFASASCLQAWRWNLDYVVTPRGASKAYYYAPEANQYLRNNTTAVSYTRGGQLSRVDYGTTGGSGLSTPAPARLLLDNVDRCSNTAAACDAAHASNAPDVPWDQACTSAATCVGHPSPTFFTQKMISKIHAQTAVGSVYSDVDLWTLTHSFPSPGDNTSPALWLTQINHSGATTTTTVPPVVFTGTSMQNRVLAVDGSALQWKHRISSLKIETGASIALGYSAQSCDPAALPTPESNTQRCFPQWWAPAGQNPKLDWFNKYVVTQVSSDSRTGGTQATDDTYYDYVGTPAWRYDKSPFIETAKRTWSQYAGYSKIRIRHGTDSSPSSQETSTYTYYQGMNGDRLNSAGGAKAVTVTASDGSAVADSLWLAGRVREAVISNGNTGPRSAPVPGPRVSSTVTTPWALQTATDGTYTAYLSANADTVTRTALSAGGDRTTQTVITRDSYGRATAVNDRGDTATTADDRCTTTSYADNTATWMLNFPSEVNVVGKACGAALTYPADAISATRHYYDASSTLGAAPTVGNGTRVDVVKGYTSTTAASAQWQTTLTSTFDSLGRTLTSTDPRLSPARTSTAAYLPTGAGLSTQVTTTNPLGWSTVTVLDPRWGVPTKVTDQNNHVTEATYDPFGRRSQVWLPQRPRASNPVPSQSYAYTVSATAPTTVATTSLTPSGGVITGYALYDGLLRARQTQTPANGGGIVVSDTLYDGAGRIATTNSPYYTPGTPGSTLFTPGTSIPGQTITGYDGAGRTSHTAQWINNSEAWRTSYSYGGDHVDVTPPDGGTATTTTIDARGNTTSLAQYHAATPTGAADVTNYSHYPAGQLKSMTDPAGNVWTWSYDVLGQLTSTHDPDKGDSTTSYDAGGNLSSATDANGNTLAYTYDTLNRKTGEYGGSTAGAQLAGWTYDTLASSVSKGQPVSATRYLGGVAFATATVNNYDAADRVTSQKMVISSGVMAGSYITTMGYTADGQLASIGHNAYAGLGGDGVSYSYDNLGNPSGAIGTGVVNYVGSTTYSAIGEVTKYQAAIGAKSYARTFTHQDGTSRLLTDTTTTNIPGNPAAAVHSYSYNDAGLVTRDQNAVTAIGADTQCFNYDHRQQLTAAWTPSSADCAAPASSAGLAGPAPYWASYTYDSIGNRTSATQHATTATGADTTDDYAYPAPGPAAVRPHAVTSVTAAGTPPSGATSFGYDSAGNTVSRPGGQTLGYDIEGRLATTTVNAQTQSNIYDADGALLQQTDSSGTTLFVGDTEVHADSGSTTLSLTRTYSYLGHPVAERITEPGVTGSTVNWLITDSHNTADVSINTATGALTRRHLDPFGKPRDPSAVAWSANHGFLNAPLNNLTGTTRLGARDYDPALGRFLTVDPLLDPGNPLQVNGYSYASNNPISNSDPTGLMQQQESGSLDCSRRQCIEAEINGSYSRGLSNGDPMPSYDQYVAKQTPGIGSFTDFVGGAVHAVGAMSDALPASSCGISGGRFCTGGWVSNRYNTTFDVNSGSLAYDGGQALAAAAGLVGPGAASGIGVGLTAVRAARAARAAGKAKAAVTAADAGGFSNSALVSSANALDRNGLTRAGRALQKHGDRPGSVFPRSVGSAESRNAQGLEQVNAILNDPNRTVEVLNKVINIYGPNGAGGVRYSVSGDFMGFLEP